MSAPESTSNTPAASESLFDTNFNTSDAQEHSQDQQLPIDTSVLPTAEVNSAIIAFRVLVSVKEAGIIIGKNGDVIADIRNKTNVKAGVSQVVQGTPDRILTVTGPIDSTAEALGLIAQALVSSPLEELTYQYFPLKRLLPPGPEGSVSLRLLVPNSQMGTIIGRQGARIKALQQEYDVKIVASKESLHNSTERIVELQGLPEAIDAASRIIARCLIEDFHNATGTIYYTPTARIRRNNFSNGAPGGFGGEATKTVNFPSDMVGCLIGKAGSRIQEIRKVTGTQINIAPQDDLNGQRAFTLIGPIRSVDKALSFLNQNMLKEQQRRERLAAEGQE